MVLFFSLIMPVGVAMVLFFSLIMPVGVVVVGIGVSSVYMEDSPTTLIIEGLLNSAASEILQIVQV
jgi:zinc transporter 1/2/3